MPDKELFERIARKLLDDLGLGKHYPNEDRDSDLKLIREAIAAALREREHERVATEINRIAKMRLKDLVGDASSILVQLSRVEAAFKKFRREPATQPTPQPTCPSCLAVDNKPYTDADGVSMRACGRCMIQWRESGQ